MGRIIKIIGGVVVLGVVGIGGFVGMHVASWPPSFPDTPLPDIKASEDPAVIAHGDYLVNAVVHCGACHSPYEEYTALKPGDKASLAGGHVWHMGPLATVTSANITQDEATGIGSWTDAEIARAIKHGIGKDGDANLFMMSVGPMSDEDLTAIVSYLRTVEPVSNEIGEQEVGVMGKVLFQTAMAFFAEPHDYSSWGPEYVPAGEASLERGTYLVEGPAFCVGCHTDYEYDGEQIVFTGQKLSGNAKNPFPDETEEGFELAAVNLTGDPETGHIAGWTKEQFFERFRSGARVHAGSPMPWETYANLTDEDLESIWLYIQSLPPTNKLVGPPRREMGWKPG